MSDFKRLEEKLSKLRERERAPGEGRHLRGTDGPSRLGSLVQEIDETILPRRLSFTVDDKTTVHLAVANRRLQAMLAPAPEAAGFEELADKPLPDIEDPSVAALGKALSALFAEASHIKISSQRLKTEYGSDIGVPSNQLDRVWDLATKAEALAPGELLTAFLGDVSELATAWLRIEGENVTDQSGDQADVDALSAHTAVFLDGYFGKFEKLYSEPSNTCGTLVGPGENGSNALFFVEVGQFSAIVTAPPAQILDIATAWQKRVAV